MGVKIYFDSYDFLVAGLYMSGNLLRQACPDEGMALLHVIRVSYLLNKSRLFFTKMLPLNIKSELMCCFSSLRLVKS